MQKLCDSKRLSESHIYDNICVACGRRISYWAVSDVQPGAQFHNNVRTICVLKYSHIIVSRWGILTINVVVIHHVHIWCAYVSLQSKQACMVAYFASCAIVTYKLQLCAAKSTGRCMTQTAFYSSKHWTPFPAVSHSWWWAAVIRSFLIRTVLVVTHFVSEPLGLIKRFGWIILKSS